LGKVFSAARSFQKSAGSGQKHSLRTAINTVWDIFLLTGALKIATSTLVTAANYEGFSGVRVRLCVKSVFSLMLKRLLLLKALYCRDV